MPTAPPATTERALTMTLHDRDSIRDHLEDSIFAGQDLSKAMPKYRFPND